jgi:LytTr DNA-binding domain
MTAPAVHASRNAFPELDRLRTAIVLPLAAAAFMALTDAFGLRTLPLPERFLYWLVLLALGQCGSILIRALLDRMKLSRTGLILLGVAICVLGSLALTIVVWAVTAVALSQSIEANRLPGFYVPVLVVMSAMVCINLLMQRRPFVTHRAAAAPGSAECARPVPFLARLPLHLKQSELYAVQAEDHYVRVYTNRGSDLILQRFADALAELDGIEGAQVHRSWWVARAAVSGAHRNDGRQCLVLRDGTKAPVSRTYVRALRNEGWL